MSLGSLNRGILFLDARGNIHQIADSQERISFAAERYVASGEGALAVTVTNRDRLEMIQEIRGMEKAEGRIGQEDQLFNTRQPVNLVGIEKRLQCHMRLEIPFFSMTIWVICEKGLKHR